MGTADRAELAPVITPMEVQMVLTVMMELWQMAGKDKVRQRGHLGNWLARYLAVAGGGGMAKEVQEAGAMAIQLGHQGNPIRAEAEGVRRGKTAAAGMVVLELSSCDIRWPSCTRSAVRSPIPLQAREWTG